MLPSKDMPHTDPHPPGSKGQGTAQGSIDDQARIFNSALIASHLEPGTPGSDVSSALYSIVESPEYRALIHASGELSRNEGISVRDAAERLIKTFRKLDRLWSEYLIREGADRLRSRSSSV